MDNALLLVRHHHPGNCDDVCVRILHDRWNGRSVGPNGNSKLLRTHPRRNQFESDFHKRRRIHDRAITGNTDCCRLDFRAPIVSLMLDAGGFCHHGIGREQSRSDTVQPIHGTNPGRPPYWVSRYTHCWHDGSWNGPRISLAVDCISLLVFNDRSPPECRSSRIAVWPGPGNTHGCSHVCSGFGCSRCAISKNLATKINPRCPCRGADRHRCLIRESTTPLGLQCRFTSQLECRDFHRRHRQSARLSPIAQQILDRELTSTAGRYRSNFTVGLSSISRKERWMLAVVPTLFRNHCLVGLGRACADSAHSLCLAGLGIVRCTCGDQPE